MKRLVRIRYIIPVILALMLVLEHIYNTYKKRILFPKEETPVEQEEIRFSVHSGSLDQKIPVDKLFLSDTGCKFLIHDLEGSSLRTRKAFLGSGKVLSIGAEYVFKYNDLINRGIFRKAGFDIYNYLSKDFINYLKFKLSRVKTNKCHNPIVRILPKEFKEWEQKEALRKEMTEEQALKLFKTYIYGDILKIRKLIKVPLNQWVFDSIIFSAYNLGLTALNRSGFFDYINKNNYEKAALILATIRRQRFSRQFRSLWDQGNISKEDLFQLVNSHEILSSNIRQEESYIRYLKNLKVSKEYLTKITSSESFINSINNYITIANIIHYSTKDLKEKEEWDKIFSQRIYKSELDHILKLDIRKSYSIKKVWSERTSILNFLYNISVDLYHLLKRFLFGDKSFWKSGEVSLFDLIEEVEHYRNFVRYFYGWCKRDFVHAGILLNENCFTGNCAPSSHNRIQKLDGVHMVDKFWYVLSNGKYKDWIFNSSSKINNEAGISNLYNKYFEGLKREFNNK